MKAETRRDETPSISIIVPAYNAEKTVAKTLQSLVGQDYPKGSYEIIVVDDGSTDGTVEAIKKFKGVKLVLQEHAGPAVARNRGVRHSKGDILLFTDADCIAGNGNWIRNMIKPLENKAVVGVCGTYKTGNGNSIVSRFVGYEIEARHDSMRRQHAIDFVGTFSAAYRRDVFLKFGGFDESFDRASGEDTDLSFKVSKSGGMIVFAPDAYVYHHHPDTLGTMLKKKFWMGYWRVPLYRKHADKLFRHSYTPKVVFVKEALIAMTLLSLILGLLGMVPIRIAAYTFALVILLSIPLSLRMFRKDRMVGILSPGIIVLRDFASGLGIAAGFLSLIKENDDRKQYDRKQ